MVAECICGKKFKDTVGCTAESRLANHKRTCIDKKSTQKEKVPKVCSCKRFLDVARSTAVARMEARRSTECKIVPDKAHRKGVSCKSVPIKPATKPATPIKPVNAATCVCGKVFEQGRGCAAQERMREHRKRIGCKSVPVTSVAKPDTLIRPSGTVICSCGKEFENLKRCTAVERLEGHRKNTGCPRVPAKPTTPRNLSSTLTCPCGWIFEYTRGCTARARMETHMKSVTGCKPATNPSDTAVCFCGKIFENGIGCTAQQRLEAHQKGAGCKGLPKTAIYQGICASGIFLEKTDKCGFDSHGNKTGCPPVLLTNHSDKASCVCGRKFETGIFSTEEQLAEHLKNVGCSKCGCGKLFTNVSGCAGSTRLADHLRNCDYSRDSSDFFRPKEVPEPEQYGAEYATHIRKACPKCQCEIWGADENELDKEMASHMGSIKCSYNTLVPYKTKSVDVISPPAKSDDSVSQIKKPMIVFRSRSRDDLLTLQTLNKTKGLCSVCGIEISGIDSDEFSEKMQKHQISVLCKYQDARVVLPKLPATVLDSMYNCEYCREEIWGKDYNDALSQHEEACSFVYH